MRTLLLLLFSIQYIFHLLVKKNINNKKIIKIKKRKRETPPSLPRAHHADN